MTTPKQPFNMGTAQSRKILFLLLFFVSLAASGQEQQGKLAYYLASGIVTLHKPGFRVFHLDFAHRVAIRGLLPLFGNYAPRIEPSFQYALSPYLMFPNQTGDDQYRPSVLGLQLVLRKGFQA